MKKLILSITLVFVAAILFLLLLIPGIIWGIGASFWNRKFKNGSNELSGWVFRWAISIDQLGNVLYKDLLDDALIDSNGIPFGNPDETISSVIGKNKLNNTLTRTGKALDCILNKLDPNHSIKSIEGDEN